MGLMGIVADAALAGGGEAIGVIPEDLVQQELAHEGLTERHVVASMHGDAEKFPAEGLGRGVRLMYLILEEFLAP